MAHGLDPRFLLGRTPPAVPQGSVDNIQFYQEHIARCYEGYSYKGYRMTPEHYFYLNFVPIPLNLPDGKGGIKIEFSYPLWSQADDYVFKQYEEAWQSNMACMLMTGRGFGKTLGTIGGVGMRGYVLEERFRGVISASGADHADTTWNLFKDSLNGLEQLHPTLKKKRLYDDTTRIQAGEEVYQGGEKTESRGSLIEKILYDKKPDKTRGKRLDFQLFEEVGAWGGAAKLKDCISASEGSWRVGMVYKCRVFYIGTGGTVLSNQAKELFFDPQAYNIYPVVQYDGRKTGIFMPAYKKYGGFWENAGVVVGPDGKPLLGSDGKPLGQVKASGISDEDGAKEFMKLERQRKSNDSASLDKYTQEYPFTAEECFKQSGSNVFDRIALGKQLTDLTVLGRYRLPERGNLYWVYDKQGRRTGVEWEENKSHGKILVWEHPPKNPDGSPVELKHAYIAGLDSIDQGKEDSIGVDGSKLCLVVKKRQGAVQQTGNLYVCTYLERPNNIDDAFDMVLRILTYYNCQVNLEYSKILIVPHFKRQRPSEYWRFIQRPKIARTNRIDDKDTHLIGTQMTEPVRVYGTNKLKEYIRENWHQIYFPEVLQQLMDYTVADKSQFDMVAAMMLCEIADEDMDELIPYVVPPKPRPQQIGYYTDPATGYKKYGVIPGGQLGAQEVAERRYTTNPTIRYLDAVTREAKYALEDPDL